MYDRTDIMRRAWAHYRRVASPNRPFDRKLFGQVLAYTWKGARVRADAERERAARRAEAPVAVSAELRPMSEMEARIDALKYLSFRYSAAAAEAAIRAEYARA